MGLFEHRVILNPMTDPKFPLKLPLGATSHGSDTSIYQPCNRSREASGMWIADRNVVLLMVDGV